MEAKDLDELAVYSSAFAIDNEETDAFRGSLRCKDGRR